MSIESLLKTNKLIPTIVGAGHIALDVIVSDLASKLWINAGGSCGNVLTILAFLGWKSFPMAHLNSDIIASIIIEDMTRWGVNTSFILSNDNGVTPIIIEKIKNDNNKHFKHQFSQICPSCGNNLPRFKPISNDYYKNFCEIIPECNVFYLDRISPFALKIAKIYKDKGALIFFEPSRIINKELFEEMVNLSDIIKFSRQKKKNLANFLKGAQSGLIIETLGENGIRFKYNCRQSIDWEYLKAFPANPRVDAAGSGDWCSAGIIHLLGRYRCAEIENINKDNIIKIINFGQALASINCRFEGARGAMYNHSYSDLTSLVNEINNNKNNIKFDAENFRRMHIQSITQICPACDRM